MKTIARITMFAWACLVLIAFSAWFTLSFLYCSWPAPVRYACAALFVSGLVAIVACVRPWRRMRNWLLGLQVVALAVGFFMFPSNQRDWQEPCARLAYAEVEGDEVIFHNVRNFDYTSESEYTPAYYDKTFNLSDLESIDVYLVNWGIKAIDHTMVSFVFAGGDALCFSFETRKEEGESYSALKGFFRKYELYAVVADERDVVRLRTNYRKGENVYVYRLVTRDRADAAIVFKAYIDKANRLKERPQWYNAVTDNCMTTAFKLGRMDPAADYRKWDWRIILNGYADEMAYERGTIDTSLPFDELKRISRINDRARAADRSPEFSRLIRVGIPGMENTDGGGPVVGKGSYE